MRRTVRTALTTLLVCAFAALTVGLCGCPDKGRPQNEKGLAKVEAKTVDPAAKKAEIKARMMSEGKSPGAGGAPDGEK